MVQFRPRRDRTGYAFCETFPGVSVSRWTAGVSMRRCCLCAPHPCPGPGAGPGKSLAFASINVCSRKEACFLCAANRLEALPTQPQQVYSGRLGLKVTMRADACQEHVVRVLHCIQDHIRALATRLMTSSSWARSLHAGAVFGFTVAFEELMELRRAERRRSPSSGARSTCTRYTQLWLRDTLSRYRQNPRRFRRLGLQCREVFQASFDLVPAGLGGRKGGRARDCPSVSIGSSTAKPGPSVAISNRMPLGSRA